MANIDIYNKQMDAAVYGEEARAPIHRSIEMINAETEDLTRIIDAIRDEVVGDG